MTLHTYNPQPMSLPCIDILHIIISEIQPRQTFQNQGHFVKVKVQGQMKVTP